MHLHICAFEIWKKNCSTEEQSDVNDMKKQTIADQ